MTGARSPVTTHRDGSSPRGATILAQGLVQIYTVEGSQVAALQGVDLTIRSGEQIAIVGPSGSGKSTLLGLLCGALRPSAGKLHLDDIDLATIAPAGLRDLRARRVGTMLQGGSRNLLGYTSAINNVRYARRALPRHTARALPAPRDLLDAVGLRDTTTTGPVARLSGGEQQRVALAVALANQPSLVLADEPTSDLDYENRDNVISLLHTAAQDLGCTTVVVTHDDDVANAMTRRLTIRDGRIDHDTDNDQAVAPTQDRHDRGHCGKAILDSQGRIPLPPDMVERWGAGTAVVIHEGDGELRIRRQKS